MSVVKTLRTIAAVLGASVVLSITALPVHAGDDKDGGDTFGGGGEEHTGGGADGQELNAGAGGIAIDESENGSDAGGTRGSGEILPDLAGGDEVWMTVKSSRISTGA